MPPTSLLSPLLNLPRVRRTRRNHGLEHATIHLLSQRVRGVSIAGVSDMRGFYLFGDVPTGEVARAAEDALARLRAGERGLAIHPHCGTNFLAAGAVAGTTAFVALLGADRPRSRLERLPMAVLLATFALIWTQPLGNYLQQHLTTSGEMGDLRITAVRVVRDARPKMHRIETQQGVR